MQSLFFYFCCFPEIFLKFDVKTLRHAATNARNVRRPKAPLFLHRPNDDGDQVVAEQNDEPFRNLPIHHGPLSLLSQEYAAMAEFLAS